MNFTIAALLFCAHASSAREMTPSYQAARGLNAEIQILVNTGPSPKAPGAREYDYKWVSHAGNIVPADILYSADSVMPHAICYHGRVDHAQRLFDIMTAAMTSGVNVRARFFPVAAVKSGPAFRIEGVYDDGSSFEWFRRVPPCNEASTPDDRATTPIFLLPYED